MKPTKRLIAGLAVALTLTGAQAVFADNAPTTPPSDSSTVTQSTSADASIIGQIDTLYNQLLELRKQTSDLDTQMKAQHEANEAAIKALRAQVNQADLDALKAVEAEIKALRDNNKTIFDQLKSLEQQYKAAKLAKDKVHAQELQLQINDLRNNQLKPVLAQIKAKSDSVKDLRQKIAAERSNNKAVFASIKTLGDQMKPIWSQIKTLEQQKHDAWTAFNAAVKAGDENAALTAMTQIVSLKQQILTDKQQISALQLQITAALAAAPAPVPTPA